MPILPKYINYLPQDGTVNYYGQVMNLEKANNYLKYLLDSINWQHDEAYMFGKHITTKRKVAWYGSETFKYTYSNITKQALPWTEKLLELKWLAEKLSGHTYNSCLLNLYHNGNEGMSWHSDGEKMLKKNGAIASMSFGAERKFSFKHKTSKQKIDIVLEHGSLLMMKDETQNFWLHRLAPTKVIFSERVNLTFRTIDVKG